MTPPTHCWSCEAAIAPEVTACAGCGSLLRLQNTYRIVRMLGQGGMGIVYEARDETLGRAVALKLMHGRWASDTGKRERFETECRAMAALNHPGIARVFAAGVHQEQLFFAQELVVGESFKMLLTTKKGFAAGPEGQARAVDLALTLLGALDHAHQKGIVHRDVNPNNVMLVERDGAYHPVLIDFGMARLADQTVTKVAWGGTPGFAAPEQILEPESNDRRSDIFAVGAMLYAVLAGGKVPYGSVLPAGIGSNPNGLLKAYHAISKGSVPLEDLTLPPFEVPRPLFEVLRYALRPTMTARYANVAAMVDALQRARPATAPAAEGTAVLPAAPGTLVLQVELPGQTSDLGSAAAAPATALPFGPGARASRPEVPAPELVPPTALAPPPVGSSASSWGRTAPLWTPDKTKGGPRRFVYAAAGGALLLLGAGVYAFLRGGDGTRGTDAAATVAKPAPPASVALPFADREEMPLYSPSDVAIGPGGEVYVADRGDHRIRIFEDGRLRTVAGAIEPGFADGPAERAKFNLPRSIGVLPDGTVVVADRMNHRIRTIKDGVVGTLAGTGEADFADGPVATAAFHGPEGVVAGPDGAVYVADTENHRIRRIKDGQVTTFAGSGTTGYVEGPAGFARFARPAAITLGPDGAVYVADDGNHRVRVVKGGTVSTVVEIPMAGGRSEEATVAHLTQNTTVDVAPDGRIFVTLGHLHRIYTVVGGKLAPFAGSGKAGDDDGDVGEARFQFPQGIGVTRDGTVYVADSVDNALRKIEAGQVTTIATTRRGGYAEGKPASARFDAPWSVHVGKDGAVYVGDWGNHRVRRILGDRVETVAGTGEDGFFDGDAANAQFSSPWDVAVAADGKIYVADGSNQRVRVVDGGQVTTLAGSGLEGFQDGPAATAAFATPEGIAIDAAGVVYVADASNHRIRTVDHGVVATLAGTGEQGLQNGDASAARFAHPASVAVAPDGTVYVADSQNHAIRAIFKGRVRTFAGTGEAGFRDGDVSRARFETPCYVAVGEEGAIYVADTGNHRIRVIRDGVVKTLAGAGRPGFGNGLALDAWFARPVSISPGPGGVLYIADSANHLVRLLKDGRVTTFAGG